MAAMGYCEPAAALGVRIAIDDFGRLFLARIFARLLCQPHQDRSAIRERLARRSGSAPSCVQRLAWRVNSASRLSPKVSRQPHNWNFSLRGCRCIQGFYFSRPVPAGRPPGCCAKVCSSRQSRAKRRRDQQMALNPKEQEHESMARPCE